MKDNSLANSTLNLMADSHFRIVSKQLGARGFDEVAINAVRAVLVDGLDPEVALTRFPMPRKEFQSALKCYSATWKKYCKDNDLVTGMFWLPPDMVALAKALETRTLNRIESRSEARVFNPPTTQGL